MLCPCPSTRASRSGSSVTLCVVLPGVVCLSFCRSLRSSLLAPVQGWARGAYGAPHCLDQVPESWIRHHNPRPLHPPRHARLWLQRCWVTRQTQPKTSGRSDSGQWILFSAPPHQSLPNHHQPRTRVRTTEFHLLRFCKAWQQVILQKTATLRKARPPLLVAMWCKGHHLIALSQRPLHVRCTSAARPQHVRNTSATRPQHVRCTSAARPLHVRCTSAAVARLCAPQESGILLTDFAAAYPGVKHSWKFSVLERTELPEFICRFLRRIYDEQYHACGIRRNDSWTISHGQRSKTRLSCERFSVCNGLRPYL